APQVSGAVAMPTGLATVARAMPSVRAVVTASVAPTRASAMAIDPDLMHDLALRATATGAHAIGDHAMASKVVARGIVAPADRVVLLLDKWPTSCSTVSTATTTTSSAVRNSK